MNVCIIGGSIAGLEAAIRLSEFCNVTVFEEHAEIGKPVKCAEGWTAFMGIQPYVDGKVIERAEVYVLDKNLKPKRKFTIRTYGKVVMVDRIGMEKKMTKIAEENGASIITGKKMTISEASHNYDLIVDASGYPSQWCREFGGKPKGAAAIEAFSDYELDELVFCLHPDTDGYFWIFPRAVGGSNVGYFKKRPPSPLRTLLDKFMERMGIEAKGYTAGLLGCTPNKPFVRHYEEKPVALVGDAAGLVDVFMGEGMTKAVISSRILAKCVKAGKLDTYEREYFRLMNKYYALFKALYVLRMRFMNFAAFIGKLNVFSYTLKLLSWIAEKDMGSVNPAHF